MSPKTPTKVRDKLREPEEKTLSLRYAEILKLRQAIVRAQSKSKSWGLERRASK